MNAKELHDYMSLMMDDMARTSEKKNADYTGGTADPFANFTVTERMGVGTTEQGMFTRMMDKVQRIASFVKGKELQVQDEKIHDTLLDLANYCLLLSAYIKSKGE